MTITKTTNLKSIKYTPAKPIPLLDKLTDPEIHIEYEIVIDDPEDDQLPIVTNRNYSLKANSDIVNEEQLVKDIFNTIFK